MCKYFHLFNYFLFFFKMLFLLALKFGFKFRLESGKILANIRPSNELIIAIKMPHLNARHVR